MAAKKAGSKKGSSKSRLKKKMLSVYLDEAEVAELEVLIDDTGLSQQHVLRAGLKWALEVGRMSRRLLIDPSKERLAAKRAAKRKAKEAAK